MSGSAPMRTRMSTPPPPLKPEEMGVLDILLGPFRLVDPNRAQARALETLRERGLVTAGRRITRAGRALCQGRHHDGGRG